MKAMGSGPSVPNSRSIERSRLVKEHQIVFQLEHDECPNEVTETCSRWNTLSVPYFAYFTQRNKCVGRRFNISNSRSTCRKVALRWGKTAVETW